MFPLDILKEPAYIKLLRFTCIFWLIAKLISWKVWLSYRLFPVIPPIKNMYAPGIIHLLLFAGSLICITSIIIFPGKKFLLLLLLILELFSCALDQNRWQPWEYQYLFTLFIFIVYKNKTERIIPSIACILVATYFYSAVSKINNGFLLNVWSDIILRRFFKISETHIQDHTLYYAGYILPIIELIGSIGLLFIRTKKPAAYVLILMHVFNLVILGPFGLKYNKVIWPWNIVMIIFLWMIFVKKEIDAKLIWKNAGKSVAFCWMLLPALNLAGWWDNYLSCNLYSGNTPFMVICATGNIDSIPAAKFFYRHNAMKICKDGRVLSIQNWALTEMNVPPYPEERVYRAVKKDWLNNYPSVNATFYVRGRLDLHAMQLNKLLTDTMEYKKLQ